MSNLKVTAMTALDGADAADGDLIPIIDISETSGSDARNKSITLAELREALLIVSTVAALPSYSGQYAGLIAYASDGRRSGEGVGAGSGCPVYFDGSNWRTFYDNTVAAA